MDRTTLDRGMNEVFGQKDDQFMEKADNTTVMKRGFEEMMQNENQSPQLMDKKDDQQMDKKAKVDLDSDQKDRSWVLDREGFSEELVMPPNDGFDEVSQPVHAKEQIEEARFDKDKPSLGTERLVSTDEDEKDEDLNDRDQVDEKMTSSMTQRDFEDDPTSSTESQERPESPEGHFKVRGDSFLS
jgi:hypothetical protein